MFRTNVALAVALLGVGTQSFAQNAYEFSGPGCSTHGTWTQTAMAETATLGQVIQTLKDKPECQVLASAVDNLKVAARDMGNAQGQDRSDTSTGEQNVNDLQSLSQSVIDANGNPVASVANSFIDKLLNSAQTSSVMQTAVSAIPGVKIGTLGGFTQMYQKSSYMAEQGLNALTAVMRVMPESSQCLINAPNQGVLLLGSLVKMTAALSSSGGGSMNNSIGNALSGLAMLIRNQKFATALRQVNRTTFDNSVSCMMETVSQHWCEIDNAQRIMKYFQNERDRQVQERAKNHVPGGVVRSDGKSLPLVRANPLNGYYMLTRELPMIAEWLQRVQNGATPRLHTDAQFQNEVLQKTTDLIKTSKVLQSQFNEDMQTLRNTYADKAVGLQKNQLFTSLNRLIGEINGGENGGADDFIKGKVNTSFLPFYLIGLDGIPKECTGPISMAMSWTQYMQNNPNFGNSYIPQFNDPFALGKTIESRLNELLQDAYKNATGYYQNFLIVDQINLINETHLGPSLTVWDALQNIYLYVSSLEKDFRAVGASQASIGTIMDLKKRIRNFNDAFQDYENAVGDMDKQVNGALKLGDVKSRKDALRAVKISDTLQAAANHVVDVAYDEFMIQKAKDSFVTNRMRTLIQMDLKYRIEEMNRARQGGAVDQAILTNTQKNLLSYTLKTIADDPTLSGLDLAQAKGIEDDNLRVIANMFSDTFYVMMLRQRSYVDGWTGEQYNQHLRAKLAKEAPVSVKNMLLPYLAWTDGRALHPDLYNELNFSFSGRHLDSYDSHKKTLGLYCSLSLSLYNRSYFMDVCKGAVLPTFYSEQAKNLNLEYDRYLPSFEQAKKISRDSTLNTASVCAFNRYLNSNRLAFIQDQEQNASTETHATSASQIGDMIDAADRDAAGIHN